MVSRLISICRDARRQAVFLVLTVGDVVCWRVCQWPSCSMKQESKQVWGVATGRVLSSRRGTGASSCCFQFPVGSVPKGLALSSCPEATVCILQNVTDMNATQIIDGLLLWIPKISLIKTERYLTASFLKTFGWLDELERLGVCHFKDNLVASQIVKVDICTRTVPPHIDQLPQGYQSSFFLLRMC